MNFNDEKVTKKYKYVPPDGGWGYLICIGTFVIYSGTTGFSQNFGLLYNEFLMEVNLSSTGVAILNGIGPFTGAIFGLIAGYSTKVVSVRKFMFIGTTMYHIGLLGMYFVYSQTPFYILYGLFNNGSYGILLNVSSTIINSYFVKNRMFAFNLTQMLTAAAAMVIPSYINWSLDVFGYRGTLLMVGVYTLHMFAAATLMHPVKWHMKKVEIIEEQEINLLLTDEEKKQITPEVKLSGDENILEQGFQERTNIIYEQWKKQSRIRKRIENMLNWKTLKPFLMSNAAIVPYVNLILELNFMTFLPLALYKQGWDNGRTSLALSLLVSGDLGMRIILIVFNKWFSRFSSIYIVLAGMCIAVAGRIGFLLSTSATSLLIFVTVIGFSRYTNMTFSTLVIAECVPAEQFASAVGLSNMIFFGILVLIIGPILGAVRDITDNYSIIFAMNTTIMVVMFISWALELWYKNKKKKSRDHKKRNEI